MRLSPIVLCALFASFGPPVWGEESEKLEPSTCYLSALGETGAVVCVTEDGQVQPLQAVNVFLEKQSEVQGGMPEQVKMILSGTSVIEDVYGTYNLELRNDDETIIGNIAVHVSEASLISPVAYRGGYRGGGAYRGGVAYRGGAAYRRGGAVVYRGGAVYRGGYGGGYCDPNYQYCGGSGYYGGGAVYRGGAAVVRRGGVAYRGGAVYRGGGARVGHHGGRRR